MPAPALVLPALLRRGLFFVGGLFFAAHRLVDRVPMSRDFLQGARRGQRRLLQPRVYLLDFVQALLEDADPFGKAAHLRDQLCLFQRMTPLSTVAVSTVMCQPSSRSSTSVTRRDD